MTTDNARTIDAAKTQPGSVLATKHIQITPSERYGLGKHLSKLIDSPGENLTLDFVNTGSVAPMRFTKPYFVRKRITSATVLRGCPARFARSWRE